jgi:hypothetical protein
MKVKLTTNNRALAEIAEVLRTSRSLDFLWSFGPEPCDGEHVRQAKFGLIKLLEYPSSVGRQVQGRDTQHLILAIDRETHSKVGRVAPA